jgi:hypothetical protein
VVSLSPTELVPCPAHNKKSIPLCGMLYWYL